jgi:superfamily II DNA or RNA helicase
LKSPTSQPDEFHPHPGEKQILWLKSSAKPAIDIGSAMPEEQKNQLPPLNNSQRHGLYAIEAAVRQNEKDREDEGDASSKPAAKLIYLLDDVCGFPEVNLAKATIRKNGKIGECSDVDLFSALETLSAPHYVQEVDLALLRLLDKVVGAFSHFARKKITTSDYDLFSLTIRRLLETGRCYFKRPEGEPLQLGPKLTSKPIWLGADGKYKLLLTTETTSESEIRFLSWHFPYYIDMTRAIIGPVNTGLAPDVARALCQLPQFSREELIAFLVAAAEHNLIDYIPEPPPECRFKIKKITPQTKLELKSFVIRSNMRIGQHSYKEGQHISALVATYHFPNCDGRLYEDESGILILERHDRSSGSPINPLIERGFISAPSAVLGLDDPTATAYIAPDAATLVELAEDDFKDLRAYGWEVAPGTDLAIMPVELDDSNLTFVLNTRDDWWFSLSLTVEFNGSQYPLLPILLTAIDKLSRSVRSAMSEHDQDESDEPIPLDDGQIECLNRNGKFFAQLDSGAFISLPFDRVKAILMALKELLRDSDSKLHCCDFYELLDYGALARARWFEADNRSLFERLRNFFKPKTVAPPKQFNATLRPYQLEGLSWLQRLAENKFAGLLADDMGLGKTVQILAHIALEKEQGRLTKPFLVICPTSVLPNWLDEVEKLTPHLKTLAYSGPDRAKRFSLLSEADIVISTYAIITRDQQLQDIDWLGVVLDEAQMIKNDYTLISQLVCQLKCEQRFSMTGTPMENRVDEIWSQFRFLLPGMLGPYGLFQLLFARPIAKTGNPRLKKLLARLIKPFVLRRRKEEVAEELPTKTSIVRTVELQGRQRELYETVRLSISKRVKQEIHSKGFKMSQIAILDALLKLRQVCCDPRLVKIEEARKVTESAKLDVLMEMLAEIAEEGRKVIVFSQFTSMIDIIAERLDQTETKFVQLRGDTRDRVTPVKQFQEGNATVFLISLKAGGTGLNLTAADTVIHYDPWWNPAVENQATDRAHRIGQDKPVFIYKLIALGTIEQRMVEFQEYKQALASSILDGKPSGSRTFSEADLELLLGPIA